MKTTVQNIQFNHEVSETSSVFTYSALGSSTIEQFLQKLVFTLQRSRFFFVENHKAQAMRQGQKCTIFFNRMFNSYLMSGLVK